MSCHSGTDEETCEGVVVLADGLSSCEGLTYLNLAGNALGAVGAAEVMLYSRGGCRRCLGRQWH